MGCGSSAQTTPAPAAEPAQGKASEGGEGAGAAPAAREAPEGAGKAASPAPAADGSADAPAAANGGGGGGGDEEEENSAVLLTVRLHKAEDLRVVDAHSENDAYCVLEVGSETVRSKTIANDNSPRWNQTFLLRFDGERPSEMKVTLWDNDKQSSHDIIGKGVLSLDGVWASDKPLVEWVELQDGDGESAGKVRLLCKASKPPTHKVTIRVVAGKNLERMDKGSETDAYCMVSCLDHSWTTATIHNSADPSWDETFVYECHQAADTISIDVADEDENSADDPVGNTKITITDLWKGADNSLTDWFTLKRGEKETGEIQVSVTVERI